MPRTKSVVFRGGSPGGHRQTSLMGVAGLVCAFWLVGGGTGFGSESLPAGQTANHLAAQKRRTATPPAYVPIDFAWVASLPAPEIRTVSDLVAVQEAEQHAVALTGYLVRIMPVPAQVGRRRGTEWELHLHMRLTPPQRCEHQDDPRNVVAVVTPAFQPPHTGWDVDVLAELCQAHTRVRLSGWLLYDYSTGPQVGRSRLSPWSIHPVTQIEVWNAREQDWDRLR